MSVATDARAEYERMIAIGDTAILQGFGAELLGERAEEVQDATAGYRAAVEQMEELEGLRWDGTTHVPLRGGRDG